MLRARTDGALLPAGVRFPAAVAVVLALAVAVVLGIRFAGTDQSGMSALDRALVRPRFRGRSALEALIWIGTPTTVAVVAVVVAVVAVWRGQRRFAALAVLGPGLTGLATTVLKPLIGRTINDDGYAYPSGHTAGAAGLGLLAAIAVIGAVQVRRTVALALLAASVVPAAVAGGGMIALGAHYPTDVIGGYATAVDVVLGSALVIDAIALRTGHRDHRSGSHGEDQTRSGR